MKTVANMMQVGGSHYQSDYQHWDWAINIRLGYLESAATKYVTRWRGKNGVQDVEKAIHYLIKAKEAWADGRYPNRSLFQDPLHEEFAAKQTQMWLDANGIKGVEAEFMWAASGWQNDVDLSLAIARAQAVRELAVAHAEQGQEAPGRAGGRVGQGAASSASTGRSEQSALGMEHPFGYDAAEEGYPERPEADFTLHKRQ
jgi:hypothetical protein